MMQIMVLDHEFHIQHPKQERHGVDGCRLNPQSTVPQQLREDHILRAEPPVVEVNREAHELHSGEGHERDAHNVKKLLRRVRVAGEQRVRVFGKMVRAVESPETQVLVHQPVVPVVVEVEDDGVHADFEREPEPVERRGALVCAVGHRHGHHGTEDDDGDQGVQGFLDAHVRNVIAFVLIAVEEAVAFANAAEDAQLVDGDEFQRQAVEDEGRPGGQVLAGIGDVGLVEEERDGGVQDHPVVELPFRGIGHLVCLLMDRDIFGVVHQMDVEEFHQPVTKPPLASIPLAPGGCHGILGVTHSSHGGQYG